MGHIDVTETMQNFSGLVLDDDSDGSNHLQVILLDVIGSGAYGMVYRALDTLSPDEHFYAVKCLHKPKPGSRQESYQAREFSLHSQVCGHPNIVTVHRVFSTDEYVYVVLDLCAGDLFTAITEHQVFRGNVALVKATFIQLVDAVHACHEAGVFHRDLKPENVLCTEDGQILLADFGLSTKSRVSKDFGCGSSYYMSPECIGKEINMAVYSTRHSDIWSLGVILVNMISGRNPWRYATTEDECFSAFLHNPDFLRQVLPISDGANAIVKRMFALNPLCRISLPELREEILKLDTFFLSDNESGDISVSVSKVVAAVSTLSEEIVALLVDKAQSAPAKNQVGDAITAVVSEEEYAFSSPDEHAPIPFAEPIQASASSHFVVEGEQASDEPIEFALFISSPDSLRSGSRGSVRGSVNSANDSEGPITPATYAVEPNVEVPDLPDDENIDESAGYSVAVAKAPVDGVPARRSSLFRSTVHRLKDRLVATRF